MPFKLELEHLVHKKRLNSPAYLDLENTIVSLHGRKTRLQIDGSFEVPVTLTLTPLIHPSPLFVLQIRWKQPGFGGVRPGQETLKTGRCCGLKWRARAGLSGAHMTLAVQT